MRRFYIDDEIVDSSRLTGEDFRHLSFSLRAKKGDEVTICCGDGYDYLCEIDSFEKDAVNLTVISKEKNLTEPKIDVTVYSAPIKGGKTEFVVQKLVELGVNKICPLSTRYIVEKPGDNKLERYRKIAVEAAKQCGRGIIPTVSSLLPFKTMLGELENYDLVIFPYENATGNGFYRYIEEQKERLNGVAAPKIAVIIGSEGGFAPEEAEAIAAKGALPVILGQRILRADTANIAVVSALMCLFGEWER